MNQPDFGNMAQSGATLRGVDRLIAHVQRTEPLTVTVMHPRDALRLGGALDTARYRTALSNLPGVSQPG